MTFASRLRRRIATFFVPISKNSSFGIIIPTSKWRSISRVKIYLPNRLSSAAVNRPIKGVRFTRNGLKIFVGWKNLEGTTNCFVVLRDFKNEITLNKT